MHRRLLRSICCLATAWLGLGASGCLPAYPDCLREAACAPTLGPRDVHATATLGPLQPLPERAYQPDPTPPGPQVVMGKNTDHLRIPPELPGAQAEPLRLPEKMPKTKANEEQRIRKLYPPLEPLGPEFRSAPGPSGRPLTLADLQALALANSPVLKRAAADVEAARGAAVQAGLHPNPTVGYEADQVQPGTKPNNNSGQQGVYINQLIKTGRKLALAQAAAGIDVLNAQVALRQAQADLNALIRANYFAALVAQESLRVTRALAELADNTYRIHLRQVLGGQVAPYEPLQLYVFAVQARANVVQARNRYLSAWKQLAATLGKLDLPCTELAGRASAPVPQFHYDAALDQALANNTSVLTAQNTILKAQYTLRLAEVTRIPDLLTNTVIQHDNAAANFQFNLQLGVNLPLWNRNQGNIQQAKAQVIRAQQDLQVTQNDLARRLAAAFERYENTRKLVAMYREQILPNQVRVYRGIRTRYEQENVLGFTDIVNAQQNVSTALGAYLTLLASQWTAVVDVANLMQLPDLYVPERGDSLPECLLGAPQEHAPPVEEAPRPRLQFQPAPQSTGRL